mgnify:CR=1 FL=1|jgi:molybdopterin/thiamine biosynthesis adenylyltransferase
MIPKVLIVGLGGIGSNLVELVVPALERCMLKTHIDLMDDDLIESTNVGHQRFTTKDIGVHKVKSLEDRYSTNCDVTIGSFPQKLVDSNQLTGYDIVIVAVDRMEPRNLVHDSDTSWLDLRCQGDGYITIDHNSNPEVVDSIPGNKAATSCQIEGAIDYQNLEFGFAMCATIGAQWLFQRIRQCYGYNTQLPSFRMGNITGGEMNRIGGI